MKRKRLFSLLAAIVLALTACTAGPETSWPAPTPTAPPESALPTASPTPESSESAPASSSEPAESLASTPEKEHILIAYFTWAENTVVEDPSAVDVDATTSASVLLPGNAAKLATVCKAYHATQYVAEVMGGNGLSGTGHDIGGKFAVGPVDVTLTPAWHNWQSESPDHLYREWKREGYCGYWLDTPDGTIWLPGDSRLLPEHLQMPAPDVILFDFSNDDWHIGLEGAVKLANAYPHARLLCIGRAGVQPFQR